MAGQHVAGPDPDQPISDTVISVIRTVVPMAWGLVVAWLIGLGIPTAILGQVHDVVIAALITILSAGWYAAWRWLEPRVPSWLVSLALGYAARPTYQAPVVAPSDPPSPATGPSPVSGSPSDLPPASPASPTGGPTTTEPSSPA